jgi:NADPH-dependent glutamate synthase beta subunit-like oxidoreductase
MIKFPHDMTPLLPTDARGSDEFGGVSGIGPIRTHQPRYVRFQPPCNNSCPAGENIQAWLALAQAGSFHKAWLKLMEENPFPAVAGRVCYHPCEISCNRGSLDSTVSIHAVERFLGDLAAAQGWQVPVGASTGKRVLVVGAGPGGLAAAYHLRRLGHAVEIHEAAAHPGGMMHSAIPAYRLPRADLLKEFSRIEAMGVTVVLNRKIEDLAGERQAGHFDAVFIAIGAQIGKRIDIPAVDASRVVTAIGLLHSTEAGTPPSLGRRVAVYGAGNTAMDAARTAKRLGAEETTIIFFSDRQHMEAQSFEAEEAVSEGIKIKWLSSIRTIGAGDLTVEIMALDAKGWPQPTGKFETLREDSVVLALGQQADTGFLRKLAGIACNADGTVIVRGDMMTGEPGIFAGGDLIGGGRTVTAAIGDGKKAARNIDAWLRGMVYEKAPPPPIVHLNMLHLPIYADAVAAVQHEIPIGERLQGFSEIVGGLGAESAQDEAKRCLSCGNCFECDNCYAACPEDAIEKLGPGLGYRINMNACTGCAVCVEQCPCHAMEMVPEAFHDPAAAVNQKAVA